MAPRQPRQLGRGRAGGEVDDHVADPQRVLGAAQGAAIDRLARRIRTVEQGGELQPRLLGREARDHPAHAPHGPGHADPDDAVCAHDPTL